MSTLDEQNIADHLKLALEELKLARHAAKESGDEFESIIMEIIADSEKMIAALEYMIAALEYTVSPEDDDEDEEE